MLLLTMFPTACFGYISDHMHSRRLLLLLGLIAFAGSTALLCVGTSISLFVAGRILQGMSAAIVWTAGLALLTDNVEKEELGKYLGFVSIAMSAGTFLGPLLGGIVYDNGGYYAVYAMAFALIGLDLLLRLVLIEGRVARMYLATTNSTTGHPIHGLQLQSINPRGDNDVSPNDTSGPQFESASNQVFWTKKYPPVIWLIGSRRLLVALLATMVYGAMLTSFDAVRLDAHLPKSPSTATRSRF